MGLRASFWHRGRGLDPVRFKTVRSYPCGGMGTPDNLAGFLLMTWPLSMALFIRAKHPFARFLWSLLAFASMTALLLTVSPAGFFGWIIGFLVFAAFILADQRLKGFKELLLPMAILLAGLLITPILGSFRNFT